MLRFGPVLDVVSSASDIVFRIGQGNDWVGKYMSLGERYSYIGESSGTPSAS
jgi:hypothetical protein